MVIYLVTIIIPTYNEINNIKSLEYQLSKLEGEFEVIFSDGFSTDGTYEAISYPKIQVAKGRAKQMNVAASLAKGEYLWFLHADSRIDRRSIHAIEKSNYDFGCFYLAFYPSSLALFIASTSSSHRVRTRKIAFGDQGIFIKKELFDKIGGYKELPIMEDYQLSIDLKEMGKPVELLPYYIYTSSRRFKAGVLRTLIKMQKLQYRHRKGMDIYEIERDYENYDGKDA